jgi:hypothetical protein
MSDPERTELGDLLRPLEGAAARFEFVRDARLFTRRPAELRPLETRRRVVRLAPNQLFRPPVPADVAVRLGRMRVTEILPDGREVARAVLQAGSLFRTRLPALADASDSGAGPHGDKSGFPRAGAPLGKEDGSPPAVASHGPVRHDLSDIVLMALDEMELWLLPAGALDREAPGVAGAARGQETERRQS